MARSCLFCLLPLNECICDDGGEAVGIFGARRSGQMRPERTVEPPVSDVLPRAVPLSRGMHVDPRQLPTTLMEPAMDAGHPAEPRFSDLADLFWLRGDEDGNVSLMCRPCDQGGNSVIRYADHSPSPGDVYADAVRHQAEQHPESTPSEPPAHVTVNVAVNYGGNSTELARDIYEAVKRIPPGRLTF